MGSYVATETVKMMINEGVTIKGSKALILGITFKENCPDIRNSRVIDIIRELESYHVGVDVYDPWADLDEVKYEYKLDLRTNLNQLSQGYHAIILAVSHQEFLTLDLNTLKAENAVVFDVKSLYPKESVNARL